MFVFRKDGLSKLGLAACMKSLKCEFTQAQCYFM